MATFEPSRVLLTMAEHEVDCIVIGGVAATIYGTTRVTVDVDLLFEPSEANRERLAAALRALDAKPFGSMGPHHQPDRQRRAWQQEIHDAPRRIDAALLGLFVSHHFDTRHGPVDCMTTVPGAPPYGETREHAQETRLESHSIYIADIDDLISMKRATGRPKDLEDVKELVAIRQMLAQEAPQPDSPRGPT